MTDLTEVARRTCRLLVTGRSDELSALVQAGCRVTVPTGDSVPIEDFDELHHALRLAFPDLRWEIVQMVASGDTVVVELSMRGTNTGRFPVGACELEPTGATITLHTCEMLRIVAGKVVEWRTWLDARTMLFQLASD